MQDSKIKLKQRKIFDNAAKKVTSYRIDTWRIPYLNAIETKLEINPDDIFLDLGAGTGQFTIEISKKTNLAVGIDISSESMKKAKSFSDEIFGHESNCFFVVCSAEKLPFKNETFSKISSIAVLEHIPNYKDVISEICRIIKKKGKILICVPNSFDRMPIIFKIWSLFWDKKIGHINNFDPEGLIDEFKNRDFRLIDKKYHAHNIKIIQIILAKIFPNVRKKNSKIWWNLECMDTKMKNNTSAYLITTVWQKMTHENL